MWVSAVIKSRLPSLGWQQGVLEKESCLQGETGHCKGCSLANQRMCVVVSAMHWMQAGV